jgi:hypothetical protein
MGGRRSYVIDDFKTWTAYDQGREKRSARSAQDKGQRNEISALCAAVLNGETGQIPLQELAETTRATFRIMDSLRTQQPISIVNQVRNQKDKLKE